MWTPLKYTLWGNYGIKRILPKVGRNLRISGQGKTTLGKCQIADLATFLCKTWKLISASHRNSSSAGGARGYSSDSNARWLKYILIVRFIEDNKAGNIWYFDYQSVL